MIGRSHVHRAFDVMRRSATSDTMPMADQTVLDEIQLQMLAHG
jgi:hypothetical protein